MARRIPASSEGNPWVHPALTLSLLVAWIVASIAILASLCASCHPKASPPKSPSPPSNDSADRTETSPPATESIQAQEQQQQQQQQEEEDSVPTIAEDEKITELETSIHGPIYPTVMPSSTSKRKLSMSLSMGIPEGLSKIKTSMKERQGKGGGAGEETIWKKTIILGEKCRLPSEEDEGEEGNQQRNYRPKTPRSLPASRTSSFANADVVPSS